MNTTSTTLEPALEFLARTLTTAEAAFNKLPGSAVIQRYVKSSHQNDPGRTILELILLIFAIRTLLQSRTRADKNYISFSDKVTSFMNGFTPTDHLLRKWTNLWTNGRLSHSDKLFPPRNKPTWPLFQSSLVQMVPDPRLPARGKLL